jgi:SAM-dependent methyltransferase
MEARQRKKLAAGGRDHRRRGQIKSRERVRDLAEVYTHEREVNAMLDLVSGMFPSARDSGNTDRTFLEPACGHGNFLVEILRRKLEYVTPRRYGRGERFEHRVLRCLASVYGIDISEDNVRESRERMRSVLGVHVENHLGAGGTTTGFGDAVEAVLETNVIHADSLAEAAEIELVEYRAGSAGTFTREWSRLDPAANELNLFSLSLRRDEAPIHYSELKDNPGPVTRGAVEKEAA